MAFPNKFLGFPIGWKNLGRVKETKYIENGEGYITRKIHKFCGNRVNVGKELDGKLFTYCPKCMIKTNNE